MMERLLHVTSSYLKFVFLCMAGSAVAFALAGLGRTNLRAFSLVATIVLLILSAVLVEIKSHRRARALSYVTKANRNAANESIIQISDFTEGLALGAGAYMALDYGPHSTGKPQIRAIIIGQWAHASPLLEEAYQAGLVTKYLETNRQELAKIGLYPFFVSTIPSEEIIRKMTEDPSRGWPNRISNLYFTPRTAHEPKKTISIGFLSTRPPSWPTQLQKIILSGFHIVRGDVLDTTKS
jgi:hypothetical protein